MMDKSVLTASLDFVLDDAFIPELPGFYRGKVRDNYDLPGGRRLIVATDRLSAFDRILTAIPFKGQILTQTARFWFEATSALCPNHVLAYPDPNVLLCRRLSILPVEIVVRDYLAGTTSTSILSMYRQGERRPYGIELPDGLRANERLPATIMTPTTKAAQGGHDEPLTGPEILARGLLTEAQWATLQHMALALFRHGSALAAERGLILADTKYEFGLDEAGRIILADEIHTPDSSRYWFAETYQRRLAAGEPPDSFDKDFVRRWVTARCDPYRDPIPPIPPALVLDTAAVYIDAFERITGQAFTVPRQSAPALERIRANLAGFF
jgi:phosphoribosylaminoimidazole-succinocarboxamide synthase